VTFIIDEQNRLFSCGYASDVFNSKNEKIGNALGLVGHYGARVDKFLPVDFPQLTENYII
jgi:hypothetical protein